LENTGRGALACNWLLVEDMLPPASATAIEHVICACVWLIALVCLICWLAGRMPSGLCGQVPPIQT
jgi:hypothetical protein